MLKLFEKSLMVDARIWKHHTQKEKNGFTYCIRTINQQACSIVQKSQYILKSVMTFCSGSISGMANMDIKGEKDSDTQMQLLKRFKHYKIISICRECLYVYSKHKHIFQVFHTPEVLKLGRQDVPAWEGLSLSLRGGNSRGRTISRNDPSAGLPNLPTANKK